MRIARVPNINLSIANQSSISEYVKCHFWLLATIGILVELAKNPEQICMQRNKLTLDYYGMADKNF